MVVPFGVTIRVGYKAVPAVPCEKFIYADEGLELVESIEAATSYPVLSVLVKVPDDIEVVGFVLIVVGKAIYTREYARSEDSIPEPIAA